MGKVTQTFDHATPAVPTLTKGMRLGAAGVSAPPLGTIGGLGTWSSADGEFIDANGIGQIDSDSAGYLYVCDFTNNRVQRFVKTGTAWVYDSKCSALSALGSSVAMPLVAIDRARNQIHLASSAQNVAGTLVGVWDLSLWPNLTVANRNRSYGTASASNGSGNLRAPMTLTLVGDFAILCSSAGDYRVIKYNHTTSTVIAQDTNSLWKARFAANADGSKYYSGAQATDTELGLWEMNTSTLVGSARLDNTSGGTFGRRNSLQQSSGGDASDLVHYDGRIYVRGFSDGRIQAWNTSDNSFSDEFAQPGGASDTANLGAVSIFKPTNIQQMKMGVSLGDSTHPDELILWASNAQNTNSQQSFLLSFPVSVATATWTKTDWSAGENTLQSLTLDGAAVGSEKFKIRLRKNGGAWITLVAGQLEGAAFATAISALGTFTDGDTLTVELSLSSWVAQNGGTLKACRNRLAPSEVNLLLGYDDSLADVYVPYASGALKGRLGGTGAFRGKLGG